MVKRSLTGFPSTARCCRALAGFVAAASLGACHVDDRPKAAMTILTYSSPMWYEETGRCFQVSADSRLALYGPGQRTRVYDVGTGKPHTAAWPDSIDQVRGGAFQLNGDIAWLGVVGGNTGWYTDSGGRLTRLALPPTTLPRWGPKTSRLTYFTPGRDDRRDR